MFLYLKEENDEIKNKSYVMKINDRGSPRRCGGLGDVLSGIIAAIISMCGETFLLESDEIIQCLIHSGKIARLASNLAFEKKKRTMSAIDVIENLGISFEQIFE